MPIYFSISTWLVCVALLSANGAQLTNFASDEKTGADKNTQNLAGLVYLPVVENSAAGEPSTALRIHAPYFPDQVEFVETAVFWFGEVTPELNYVDGRVAYTPEELYLHLAIFDRRLWYDKTPTQSDLESWDAVSVYLNLDGPIGAAPGRQAYRFIGQLRWWEESPDYQAAYQGDGQGWQLVRIPFSTEANWRGQGPNNDEDDRGWWLRFRIPFSSLGLSGAPPEGSQWGLAVVLHDRDWQNGDPIADQSWPATVNPGQPLTWGRLGFGLPEYPPPHNSPAGNTIIRHKLNGEVVVDGQVGGGTNCGMGMDFFQEWGEANYSGAGQVNVQNQFDVADFPCFSKFYVTFPLGSIPSGKTILGATLTLHQFGNAGGGQWGPAPSSLIQVSTAAGDWDETSLTWNNAPLAAENVGRAWVDWLSDQPPWPGVARSWDVSHAVAEAYASGYPLRLVLYSADSARHSGKYFVSSDTGDWNEEGRPTLQVTWGEIE
jgi:hypothetical protein